LDSQSDNFRAARREKMRTLAFWPDLKLIVLSKGMTSTNPGEETSTEIRELDRSAPDASLFEIPADYKIGCRWRENHF
jgi:hypothetical protein